MVPSIPRCTRHTRKGRCLPQITRDRLLQPPLGPVVLDWAPPGPGPACIGAQVCGRLAALSNGSLLQSWLPREQNDIRGLGCVLRFSSLPYPGGPGRTLDQGWLPMLVCVQGLWLGPVPQGRALTGPRVGKPCLGFVLCPVGWQIAWDRVLQALGGLCWCVKMLQGPGSEVFLGLCAAPCMRPS
ncbi:hypothetical protein NDU88_007829 [Pleurodeles waltl]|uniref:Uncharacterized protein n=1 Tax=Pleurodeles waltl TaxID=8319 RepID=A0AAV7RT06_PLEWA|nr:hypothetical protein NDU88_007829 [Pleurodeles waltl]